MVSSAVYAPACTPPSVHFPRRGMVATKGLIGEPKLKRLDWDRCADASGWLSASPNKGLTISKMTGR